MSTKKSADTLIKAAFIRMGYKVLSLPSDTYPSGMLAIVTNHSAWKIATNLSVCITDEIGNDMGHPVWEYIEELFPFVHNSFEYGHIVGFANIPFDSESN